MASSLLGVVVGTIAAFSMVAQFSAFIGMPAAFYFPYQQLFIIFIAGMFIAILSAFGPTR